MWSAAAMWAFFAFVCLGFLEKTGSDRHLLLTSSSMKHLLANYVLADYCIQRKSDVASMPFFTSYSFNHICLRSEPCSGLQHDSQEGLNEKTTDPTACGSATLQRRSVSHHRAIFACCGSQRGKLSDLNHYKIIFRADLCAWECFSIDAGARTYLITLLV